MCGFEFSHDVEFAALQAVAACALEPATTPAARKRAIAKLLKLAGARREPLEAVRAALHGRLAHRSDDFEATHALLLIDSALAQATPPDGPWRWQERERRGRAQVRRYDADRAI